MLAGCTVPARVREPSKETPYTHASLTTSYEGIRRSFEWVSCSWGSVEFPDSGRSSTYSTWQPGRLRAVDSEQQNTRHKSSPPARDRFGHQNEPPQGTKHSELDTADNECRHQDRCCTVPPPLRPRGSLDWRWGTWQSRAREPVFVPTSDRPAEHDPRDCGPPAAFPSPPSYTALRTRGLRTACHLRFSRKMRASQFVRGTRRRRHHSLAEAPRLQS